MKHAFILILSLVLHGCDSGSFSGAATGKPGSSSDNVAAGTDDQHLGTGPSAGSGGSDGVSPASVPVDAVLESITVEPSSARIGLRSPQLFRAIGNYSNGDSADISDRVSWQLVDSDVASLSTSAAGASVSGQANGTTQVRAVLDELTGEAALTVSFIQAYFAISRQGDFDESLNDLVGTSHAFSSFNFKSHAFKLLSDVRLLSRINFLGKQSYSSGDISISHSHEQSAQIDSINRHYAERSSGSCVLVPSDVFAAHTLDLDQLKAGGTYLSLNSSSGNSYIFKQELRDRWGATGQGSCYPSIHSSRHTRYAALVNAPSFSGSAYPWADDGYSNTYGNGAYVYVASNGELRLRYETQTSHSRVIVLLALTADD